MVNEQSISRREFIQTTALALPLLAAGCASLETESGRKPSPVKIAALNPNGRRIMIQLPGLAPFSCGFSATIENGGERQILSSMSGMVGEVIISKEMTPCGWTRITESTIHFDQVGIDIMLRFGEVPNVSGALFQAGLRNLGATAINLRELTQLETDAKSPTDPDAGIQFTGDPADWLVTQLMGNFDNAVSELGSIHQPLNVSERGGIYRRDGTGFLFGPVGTPIAYLNSSVCCEKNGRVTFKIAADMSGVRVDPNETRWGQQAVLLMEKPHIACARQADWVAFTHHGRTSKGALDGWCSWYLLDKHVTGQDVLGIVEAVANNPEQLHPGAIQIDDGYQKYDGVWDANHKFPGGMSNYAKRIAEIGARPGLWMALTLIGRHAPWLDDPVNLEAVQGQKFKKESDYRPDESGWLDPTHPRAKAHIADQVRHAVKNGYTYLKLDFNDRIGEAWFEKKRTSFEVMRDLFTLVRQTAGEDVYILFCTPCPVRAVVGLVDSSRTSYDAHRGGVRMSINQVLRSFDLNNRWFAVDNDCYYLATGLKGIGDVVGGWPIVQTYASMMGLSSGAAFTSDMWNWEIFKPYLRHVEIMTPPAKERTLVLDIGISKNWPRLVSHVNRPWGKWTVALLWNPNDHDQAIKLDFAQAGLNPAHRHAVWSFWGNRFLGIVDNQWETPVLPADGCQHLCFTDLDQGVEQPRLIGSNLHIFCGAAEIKEFKASASGVKLLLSDAGARTGDIYIYSRRPLKVSSASGLSANSLQAVDENIWRLGISSRKRGKSQQISLQSGN